MVESVFMIKRRDNQARQGGFTLVESAIIIMVLGLVLAPFFAYLGSEYKKRQMIQNEEINQTLTAAIAVYVAENGRYPCPANFSLQPDNADFGVEERNAAGTDCLTGSLLSSSGDVYIGAVPVRTLRLPPKAAANVYGWKHFYAVSNTHIENLSSSSPPRIDIRADLNLDGVFGDGAGTVQCPPGTAVPTPNFPINDNMVRLDPMTPEGCFDSPELAVPFVIVNVGRNGRGSAKLDAGDVIPFPCVSGVADFENCDFTPGAGMGGTAFLFRDRVIGDGFDDILTYTLAREETTFWKVEDTLKGDGQVNITTRGDGRVGIGTSGPQEKLHIRGGNLNVRGSDDDDRLFVDENATVGNRVEVQGGNLVGDKDPAAPDKGMLGIGADGAFYYP